MTDDAQRNRPPLTPEHLFHFGGVITSYASCEIMLKTLLAAMTNTNHLVLHTLTYGMTGPALLLKIRAMNALDHDAARRDQVEGFIQRLEAASALRNEIAHGSWSASQRPGGIRPSGMSVKAKGAKVIGFEDAEKDYLVEDLGKVAEDLTVLGADLMAFLRNVGIAPQG